jgi:hypothetical protein
MIGFGLDLSGYSTGGTCLAAVDFSGDTASAVILQGSALCRCRHGVDDAQQTLAEEREDLLKCMTIGPLAVDVPIDLQGLPAPEGCTFIWEFSKRPIDYAFGAMAPLADRLGACVARFKAVLGADDLRSKLGRRLFETYPAGTLALLGIANKRYKGTSGRELCSAIAKELEFDDCSLIDHELDAIICAITAAAPTECRLAGKRLVRRMHEIDPFTEITPRGRQGPTGFIVLDRWPCRRLRVSKEDFRTWIRGKAHNGQ